MDEKKPLIDFKTVYRFTHFDVMVDTTTDVCYIMTKNDVGIPSVQVMLTPEGKPRTLHYTEKRKEELEQEIEYLKMQRAIDEALSNDLLHPYN